MCFNQGTLLLFFFGLLLIGQRTVSAQNKPSGNLPFGESKSVPPKMDTPVDEPSSFLKATDVDQTIDERLSKDKNFAAEQNQLRDNSEFKYQFRLGEGKRRNFDFADGSGNEIKMSFRQKNYAAKSGDGEPLYIRETTPGRGFDYTGAIKQSLLFLGVQHGYAVLGQAKTRRALKHGPFFKDYIDSVKSLHGWDDGGRFFTNYIAHPMQGALTGHVYVQNSPQALREQFSMSTKYWKTRMKAMLWTAAWSTQFEIGPVSQASIGNVGLKGKQTYEDIVVTPTAGMAMLIAEDALDRYAVEYIERRTSNRYIKIFARMLLNPTRNFSNLLRFREPWYRDRPAAR